jgi:hypothetical protein
VIAILSIDWFWTCWLAVIVIVDLFVAILGVPALVPVWVYPLPLYVAAAGLASIVYAVVYDVFAHPPVGRQAAEAQLRDSPEPASTGESIIPAGIGNGLVIVAVFMNGAFYMKDPVIAFVGLPLVFLTGPLFAMFAFGYIRGQPDVGGFAYRTMPYGLAAFIGLTLFVLGARWLGVEARVILIAVGAIGVALFAVNVVLNIERRESSG